MRILYYNWAPFDQGGAVGGGVSVYQRNLIEALADEHEVTFLFSGLAYDPLSDRPRIRETKNALGARCRSFELVNSPVPAPGHAAFGWNRALFDEGEAHAVFLRFLRATGPFDVVHFNNLEGIPFSFLAAKRALPGTTFVLSAHNYFLVCPQVNLWRREIDACFDFRDGRNCVFCLPKRVGMHKTVLRRSLESTFERLGMNVELGRTRLLRKVANGLKLKGGFFGKHVRAEAVDGSTVEHAYLKATNKNRAKLGPGAYDALAGSFAARRRSAVDLVNKHCDRVLAVSDRTRDILERYGVERSRLETVYIGTSWASQFDPASVRRTPQKADILTIGYFGYMRMDKGFFFLLDALERMPPTQASKTAVVIAARISDSGTHHRLLQLQYRSKFASLDFYDGFGPADLPLLLAEVDLGIVPPIWEDNLPQVAIELVSSGIPILCSDRGGARELGGNEVFVFRAGDVDAFLAKLKTLAEQPALLATFWTSPPRLVSMAAHVEELLAIYGVGRTERSEAPVPAPAAPKPAMLPASV